MTDIVKPQKRSEMMAGIRNRDTRPEKRVRAMLHHAGFRYRLHNTALPGTPDLWLARYRAVIEVNGCFWHGHDCHLFKLPSSRITSGKPRSPAIVREMPVIWPSWTNWVSAV